MAINSTREYHAYDRDNCVMVLYYISAIYATIALVLQKYGT